MEQLPDQKYDILYVDPPWKYNNTISNGAAENHYPCMRLDELMQMPINKICKENCVMFMWHVSAMPHEALKLVEAWGFKFKTMKGFTWVKLNKRFMTKLSQKFNVDDSEIETLDQEEVLLFLQSLTKMNGGNYTRANSEDVLVAIKGKGLPRADASVRQLIFAPIGENSEKPDIVRKEIERVYGDNVKRIELFSRHSREGWDAFGNQVGKMDSL